MSHFVKVKLWGTQIGTLGYAPHAFPFATFEYDPKFLKMGISPSPLKLPINKQQYVFDHISEKTFHGLPGFIADSLPDKFGNQLIDHYFALQGKSPQSISALDRLLYVGNRAMGALEFEPSEKSTQFTGVKLDLYDLSKLAEMVLTKKEAFHQKLNDADRHTAISLLRIGSSAGGARSKALVAMDNEGNIYDGTMEQEVPCRYYLLKFDSDDNSDRDKKDPKGMTKIEYIYSLLARQCGIDIPHTAYIRTGDDFHFLIERFDRTKTKEKTHIQKLHYVSWAGMAHAHRDTTGAYSYEQLVLVAREIGLGQEEITEIFKRAVFNIVGRNQDDHTKNFGFLMDRNGKWRLAPAFDMTYAYDPFGKWTNVHQISLNTKQDLFTLEDMIRFGRYCNLHEKRSKEILHHTLDAFATFENLATEYDVTQVLKQTVQSNMRMRF